MGTLSPAQAPGPAPSPDYAQELVDWVFASPEGQAERVRAALALAEDMGWDATLEDPAPFIAALHALDIPAGAR